MRINRFLGIASLVLAFSSSGLMAQNFQTFPISSGYNADVIANGVGPSTVSTSIDVDGVDFAFVARDFQLTSTSAPITYGIPIDGIINSVVSSTPGLSYQLGSLSANNSLRLATIGQTGTLVFTTPKAAFKLYMLSTSGSGSSNVDVTVTFTDNTTQVFTNQALSDWYNGSNFAIQGIGRITRSTGALEASSTNPRLYQGLLTIDAANHSKPIQSVTVTKVGTSTGVSNVFAFAVDAYSTCAAPILQPVGTLTANSAQVSWTVPAGTTASSYDIYYSTTNTAPTSTSTPNITGITGTTYTIDTLAPTTTYYYWVRSNCSGSTSQSSWSFSGTFTTLCGALVPAYTNTFSPFPGGCWALNLIGGDATTGPTGTGSAIWVQDGFLNNTTVGAARINLYSTNRKGWMKTVPFNLTGGAYRVKFDYGVTAYTGTAASTMGSDDMVQFLVSNDGGSTWTVLQTWNAGNAPTNTLSTYTYDLVGYNSANTVFAVFGSDGTVDDSQDYNFYVDNFIVELSNLSTAEVDIKKKLSIHPNPFKDVLYISETKDIKSVMIYDVAGRMVKLVNDSSKEIRVSDLKEGMYLVKVNFKDGSQSVTKVIKK